ncbi:MAG TPA: CYTH domain-containing protein [Bacillales bacterium]|nr:CYTH domain-containing protein [Bacillales bacterium]
MSQEIEIECKNMLTAQEFEQLCSHFEIGGSDFTRQHNHYFDTPEFMLKNKGCALRIREKNNRSTLTLKQPHPDGLLETHQPLTDAEAEEAKKGSKVPDGEVTDVLSSMNIPVSSLKLLGTLSTERAEFTYENGLLVLDHSYYLDTEDYELEYESPERAQGEKTFYGLLNTFGIEKRETDNKIRRFFNRKRLYKR